MAYPIYELIPDRITVSHLKDHISGEYIGREYKRLKGSPLGNPFYLITLKMKVKELLLYPITELGCGIRFNLKMNQYLQN